MVNIRITIVLIMMNQGKFIWLAGIKNPLRLKHSLIDKT